MKAEELRIGNCVNYFNDGEYSVIRTLDWDYAHLNDASSIDYELLKPIPLKEEWLLKFGFEKGWSCDNYDRYESDDFEMLKDYGEQGVAIAKNKHSYNHVYCGYYENEIECNYVHQLQNLYYALTQKELNYEG